MKLINNSTNKIDKCVKQIGRIKKTPKMWWFSYFEVLRVFILLEQFENSFDLVDHTWLFILWLHSSLTINYCVFYYIRMACGPLAISLRFALWFRDNTNLCLVNAINDLSLSTWNATLVECAFWTRTFWVERKELGFYYFSALKIDFIGWWKLKQFAKWRHS